MLKLACTFLAIGVAGVGYVGGQATAPAAPPAQITIPAAASQRANPVRPTDEVLAKAKRLYKLDCAMCHGATGNGKGDIAVSANFNIKDYRQADSLKGRTDGDLFYIIRKGYGNMPAEDKRASDADVWGLVHYLRSFSK